MSAPPPYSSAPAPAPAPSTQPQTVTVVQQPQVIAAVPNLGDVPTVVTCPTGGHQVQTQVSYKIGLMVWVVAGVMVLLGLLCFAWIPFLINGLKDVVHTCPEDGTVIGVYERLKF